MKKSIDTAKISEHRSVLLGLATIMIFGVHAPEIIYKNYTLPLYLIIGAKWLLTTGVDIFLFLSGMGLYRSLLNDPDIRRFYRKRAERVLPSLLIVLILWAAVKKYSFLEFVKSITLLEFWIDGKTITWYFALLMPLYILFPLIFKAINSGKLKLPVAIGASLGLNLILHLCASEFYDHTIIALSRVPIFLCGVYFSRRMFKEKKSMKLPRRWLYICLVGALVCIGYILVLDSNFMDNRLYYICKYIINYGALAKNYIRFPFSLCLMVLFSCLKLNDSFIRRAAEKIGEYSMEVYLVQERIQLKLDPLLSSTAAQVHTFLFDIVTLVLTAAAVLLLKKLSALVLKIVKKPKEKTGRTEVSSR